MNWSMNARRALAMMAALGAMRAFQGASNPASKVRVLREVAQQGVALHQRFVDVDQGVQIRAVVLAMTASIHFRRISSP